MEEKTLICGTENIACFKGYIILKLKDYTLPATLEVDGDTLLKKDELHVSLLCVKNLLKLKPDIEPQIIEHFCMFLHENEILFEGFTGEYRLARRAERKTVVAMCTVSSLHEFADYLSDKIGIAVPHQPTHVTLYTLQPNLGIGLNSPQELEDKTVPCEVPKEVSAILANA